MADWVLCQACQNNISHNNYYNCIHCEYGVMPDWFLFFSTYATLHVCIAYLVCVLAASTFHNGVCHPSLRFRVPMSVCILVTPGPRPSVPVAVRVSVWHSVKARAPPAVLADEDSRSVATGAPEAPESRTVYVNKEQPPNKCMSNSITTAKYSVFSFLPKFLFEQFRRYSNIFFLFIALLQVSKLARSALVRHDKVSRELGA